MTIVAILPARMGSSRFPGKPLAPLNGLSMIEHVYRRTSLCRLLDAVYVATCDREIAETVERFGGRAILTSPLHERASDRVAEAAAGLAADVVVMVQGDEPMIVPQMIDEALGPMHHDPSVVCTNLAGRIGSLAEYEDPNTIKVVMARNGDALYFSRRPIPWLGARAFAQMEAFKQICVIPFRKDFLLRYAALEPTPLEKAESVDMMRVLEHGYRVRLVHTTHGTHAVDTPDDLARVAAMMRNDPVAARYQRQA